MRASNRFLKLRSSMPSLPAMERRSSTCARSSARQRPCTPHPLCLHPPATHSSKQSLAFLVPAFTLSDAHSFGNSARISSAKSCSDGPAGSSSRTALRGAPQPLSCCSRADEPTCCPPGPLATRSLRTASCSPHSSSPLRSSATARDSLSGARTCVRDSASCLFEPPPSLTTPSLMPHWCTRASRNASRPPSVAHAYTTGLDP
mmetsp:Transcript_46699/g.113712  ORF Transcript_46699/g.113712 Transcript_46699/m.113712 type:complete len:203 (-) Transcript_46699:1781-2389(-)